MNFIENSKCCRGAERRCDVCSCWITSSPVISVEKRRPTAARRAFIFQRKADKESGTHPSIESHPSVYGMQWAPPLTFETFSPKGNVPTSDKKPQVKDEPPNCKSPIDSAPKAQILLKAVVKCTNHGPPSLPAQITPFYPPNPRNKIFFRLYCARCDSSQVGRICADKSFRSFRPTKSCCATASGSPVKVHSQGQTADKCVGKQELHKLARRWRHFESSITNRTRQRWRWRRSTGDNLFIIISQYL